MAILKTLTLLATTIPSLAFGSPVIKIAKAEFLGNITSNTNTINDLGFHGTIGDVGINVSCKHKSRSSSKSYY